MALIARSPKQFGNIIQNMRKRKGWTQTQLAEISGVRQELISRIEGGHGGTKLLVIYALFAALDLEFIIETRSSENARAADIEDIF